MKNPRRRKNLVDILKGTIRKPLAYILLAGSTLFSGCQIAQVTYMKNLKDGKETPLFVEQAAKHRLYLDQMVPITFKGNMRLAGDCAERAWENLKDLNLIDFVPEALGIFKSGIEAFIVPSFYWASQNRAHILADTEQDGIVKPLPNGLAYASDVVLSTPGDVYRTISALLSPRSSSFVPPTWNKGYLETKYSVVGLTSTNETELANLNKRLYSNDNEIDAGRATVNAIPLLHHPLHALFYGDELESIKKAEGEKPLAPDQDQNSRTLRINYAPSFEKTVVEATSNRIPIYTSAHPLPLTQEYLEGLNVDQINYGTQEAYIQNAHFFPAQPATFSYFLLPIRDGAFAGAFLYPLIRNGSGGGGNNAGGLTGGRTGGPGGR